MTTYEPWMPGAAQHPNSEILANSLHQEMSAKVIAHITADRNASAGSPLPHVSFESLLSWFTGGGKGMAPHILWDPFTGQFAQFFPAWSRSLSVLNGPNGEQTNRYGKFVIQIEAVFFPHTEYNGKVYAELVDTPCIGWDKLHAWIKSLGIPDEWPSGYPHGSGDSRSLSNFENKAGWFGHSQVPWNDHIDPMSWPAFPKPPVVKPPVPPVKPPVPPVKPPVDNEAHDKQLLSELEKLQAQEEAILKELTTDENKPDNTG